MGFISGFHAGMHGGSLLIILGAWAIIGILGSIFGLIIKAIISSMYPENINKESTKSDISSTKNSSSSLNSNTDGKDWIVYITNRSNKNMLPQPKIAFKTRNISLPFVEVEREQKEVIYFCIQPLSSSPTWQSN